MNDDRTLRNVDWDHPQLQSSAGPGDPDALAALVRECIGMMRSGGIRSLDLKYGELELRLRAHRPGKTTYRSAAGRTPAAELAVDGPDEPSTGHVITAPMIGTFYHSAAPGEPAFVKPGDRIEEGQTIGIIEAMKIMNEIAADKAGVVEAVLAGNGQTVEYGSPLIRLAPSSE